MTRAAKPAKAPPRPTVRRVVAVPAWVAAFYAAEPRGGAAAMASTLVSFALVESRRPGVMVAALVQQALGVNVGPDVARGTLRVLPGGRS